MDNRVRVQLTFAPSVKSYIELEAENLGMTQSAFMTMVVQQYRQQSESLQAIKDVNIAELWKAIEELKETK